MRRQSLYLRNLIFSSFYWSFLRIIRNFGHSIIFGHVFFFFFGLFPPVERDLFPGQIQEPSEPQFMAVDRTLCISIQKSFTA